MGIKEALRKFEKSWVKRGKDKYTEKKLLHNPTAITEVDDELLDVDMTEEDGVKEQSPTAAPVVDDISTPEEEDEAMKEIYERPSPSPTESIGSSIEAKENEIHAETNTIAAEITPKDQAEQIIGEDIQTDPFETNDKEVTKAKAVETIDLIEAPINNENVPNKKEISEINQIDNEIMDKVDDDDISEVKVEEKNKNNDTERSNDVTAPQIASDNDNVEIIEKEFSDANVATIEKDFKDANVATIEKDFSDANVATIEKDFNDANIMTDKKEVVDVLVETDAKVIRDFQQQTDNITAKTKLNEFLNVMKELSIYDLTEVISKAAEAIKDKSL